MINAKINKHYSFSLYSSPVISSTYQNAKLLSMLDYDTALKFSNIELIQKQIFPYLPPGTNPNHTEYTYYLFNHKDKNVVIAESWIIDSSFAESSSVNYNIRLNNVSTGELNIVRDQLRLLGISFDILWAIGE